jgi:hypothetical protein
VEHPIPVALPTHPQPETPGWSSPRPVSVFKDASGFDI